MDDEFLKIFPEKSGDKGHTYPLHELWRAEFRAFDPADSRGARQYDDAILARVRPTFEKEARQLVEKTVAHAYAEARAAAREPDATKALTAAEKNGKTLANTLHKLARDGALLDREFDQFGLNALKSLLKEVAAKVPEWAASVVIPPRAPALKKGAKPKAAKPLRSPEPESFAQELLPQLRELAKLDGYNVWRRSGEIHALPGKLVCGEVGKKERRPTLQSWIVPVRKWAERESWGEDPKTKQPIATSTHEGGIVRADYLDWLRDTLKIFDDDATVKEEHLDRLDPECLEALGFNLSAGRHKPFLFDPGQHRPPTELIHELQAVHGEVQKRLGKLLAVVGGGR